MVFFGQQYTSIWSFPERGEWSTHKGDYPGNWSPYVPRNVIARYSKEGEIVLDQFLGSGTTAIECALMNRNIIGLDINEKALRIAIKRIENFSQNLIKIEKGNALKLSNIENDSIDLICTHPPYGNIIKYSSAIDEDISRLDIEEFYNAMDKVAKECYRVLKTNKYCAILIGDTRKNGSIIPLGFKIMNIFLDNGFTLKEIIIKEQHNCKSTEKWRKISIEKNFYLIAHEYLFIFKNKKNLQRKKQKIFKSYNRNS